MVSTISPYNEDLSINKGKKNKNNQNISTIGSDKNRSKINEEKISESSKISKNKKTIKMRETKIHIDDDIPSTEKQLILKDNKSSKSSENKNIKEEQPKENTYDTNQNLLTNDKEIPKPVRSQDKKRSKKSKKSVLVSSSSDSDDEKYTDSNKETNKKWYKSYYLTNLSMKLQQDIGAVTYSDEMLMNCDELLNKDQINIILSANYSYITKLRKSHRQLLKILSESKDGKNLVNEIKMDKEKKIIQRCQKFIKVINDYILTKEYSKEMKALFLKTKADYYRYLAEVTKDHELFINKQNALYFYMEARELTKDLDHLNPTKLDVALNYSVFLNEIMNKRINSYFAAKEAVFNALSDLKNCTEEELAAEEMRDSLVCIEILNRNVENWYNEEMEADNEEAERKKKEMLEKNEQKEKGNLDKKDSNKDNKDEKDKEENSEEEEEKEEDFLKESEVEDLNSKDKEKENLVDEVLGDVSVLNTKSQINEVHK